MRPRALLSIMLVFAAFAFAWGEGVVRAEEENKGILDPSHFSATTTIATDYVFRGISQTMNGPALQGGPPRGKAGPRSRGSGIGGFFVPGSRSGESSNPPPPSPAMRSWALPPRPTWTATGTPRSSSRAETA